MAVTHSSKFCGLLLAVLFREVLADKSGKVEGFCDRVTAHADFFVPKAGSPDLKMLIKSIASDAIRRARRHGKVSLATLEGIAT
jgi:hypothetical protein